MEARITAPPAPWIATAGEYLEIMFWLIFWPLTVIAIAGGLRFLNDTRRLQHACVKVESVDWAYRRSPNGRGTGVYVPYVQYRFPGSAQPIRSRGSWPAIAGGTPPQDPKVDAWLAASCVPVWFREGEEHRARPEPPALPFTDPFGPGQLALGLLLAVGMLRLAAVRAGAKA